MNIVLMGPPYVGKTTGARFIEKRYGLKHIYPGDLIRQEIESQTELGKSIAQDMADGKLASNEIVMNLVKKAISDPGPNHKGFVFDGVPRFGEQANSLQTVCPIDFIIYLEAPQEVLLQRAKKRGEKEGRPEDLSEKSQRVRFDLFKKHEREIKEYYQSQNTTSFTCKQIDDIVDKNTVLSSAEALCAHIGIIVSRQMK